MMEGKAPVRIKGVGNSIWVTIVPDTPFELIEAELARLFEPLKNMVSATPVVLDTGSGQAGAKCRRQASNYLKDAFNLEKIVSPQEKDRGEKTPNRMKKTPNIISHYHRDTLVLAGRVRSGQSVRSKKHLIIMGDVNPGCELTAGGDIMVIGSLRGSAAAGQPDNRESIILALDFRPTQVKIGKIVAAGLPTGGHGAPEFAHIENGGIIVDDYLEANPFKRIPWPVIR